MAKQGRQPFYSTGKRERQLAFKGDDALYARLKLEAQLRDIRDGAPGRWKVARVLYEDACEKYGIPLTVNQGA